jgi:hypothetical protein
VNIAADFAGFNAEVYSPADKPFRAKYLRTRLRTRIDKRTISGEDEASEISPRQLLAVRTHLAVLGRVATRGCHSRRERRL